MVDCIFCKIIARKVPSEIIYEDDLTVVFKDVNPQAPTHLLIVPKKHVAGLSACGADDTALLGHIQQVAAAVAGKADVASGYRLVTNNGRDAGQSVDHLHYHLLGGRCMQWPPG